MAITNQDVDDITAAVVDTLDTFRPTVPPEPEPEPPPSGDVPVPETNSPDANPLFYDGIGGMERDNLYGTWTQQESGASAGVWMPWAKLETIGDWLDADGVFEGSKSFVQVTVNQGQTGNVTIPIPPGLNSAGPVQMVLRNVGNSLAEFVSKDGGTPPTLGGQAAECDATCDSSTYQNMGSQGKIVVSSSQCVYLRFPPGAAGNLVLRIQKVWQTGPIGVFAFAPPIIKDSSPVKWLSDDDTRLIYASNNMLPTGEPVGDSVAAQFDNTSDPSYHSRARVTRDDGQEAVRIITDPALASAFYILIPIWPEARIAAFQYWVEFKDSFLTALKDSGKMPGLGTSTRTDDPQHLRQFGFPLGTFGTPYVGSGTQSTGRNGWWPRGGYLRDRPAPHPLAGRIPLDNYVYYPDRPPGQDYGEGWPWSKFGIGTLKMNRPYCVYQEVGVNTPGVHDGWMESRIDGQLAMRRDNIMWRQTPPYDDQAARSTELMLRNAGVFLYHGGKSMWKGAGEVDFWGFKVARLG